MSNSVNMSRQAYLGNPPNRMPQHPYGILFSTGEPLSSPQQNCNRQPYAPEQMYNPPYQYQGQVFTPSDTVTYPPQEQPTMTTPVPPEPSRQRKQLLIVDPETQMPIFVPPLPVCSPKVDKKKEMIGQEAREEVEQGDEAKSSSEEDEREDTPEVVESQTEKSPEELAEQKAEKTVTPYVNMNNPARCWVPPVEIPQTPYGQFGGSTWRNYLPQYYYPYGMSSRNQSEVFVTPYANMDDPARFIVPPNQISQLPYGQFGGPTWRNYEPQNVYQWGPVAPKDEKKKEKISQEAREEVEKEYEVSSSSEEEEEDMPESASSGRDDCVTPTLQNEESEEEEEEVEDDRFEKEDPVPDPVPLVPGDEKKKDEIGLEAQEEVEQEDAVNSSFEEDEREDTPEIVELQSETIPEEKFFSPQTSETTTATPASGVAESGHGVRVTPTLHNEEFNEESEDEKEAEQEDTSEFVQTEKTPEELAEENAQNEAREIEEKRKKGADDADADVPEGVYGRAFLVESREKRSSHSPYTRLQSQLARFGLEAKTMPWPNFTPSWVPKELRSGAYRGRKTTDGMGRGTHKKRPPVAMQSFERGAHRAAASSFEDTWNPILVKAPENVPKTKDSIEELCKKMRSLLDEPTTSSQGPLTQKSVSFNVPSNEKSRTQVEEIQKTWLSKDELAAREAIMTSVKSGIQEVIKGNLSLIDMAKSIKEYVGNEKYAKPSLTVVYSMIIRAISEKFMDKEEQKKLAEVLRMSLASKSEKQAFIDGAILMCKYGVDNKLYQNFPNLWPETAKVLFKMTKRNPNETTETLSLNELGSVFLAANVEGKYELFVQFMKLWIEEKIHEKNFIQELPWRFMELSFGEKMKRNGIRNEMEKEIMSNGASLADLLFG